MFVLFTCSAVLLFCFLTEIFISSRLHTTRDQDRSTVRRRFLRVAPGEVPPQDHRISPPWRDSQSIRRATTKAQRQGRGGARDLNASEVLKKNAF